MDCPECKERPAGFFSSFRFGGLSFKERSRGYFKCKNCGTLLRQKRSSIFFPKFKKGFWVAYPLLIALFASFTGYVLSYLVEAVLQVWQTYLLLGFGIFVTVGISDELRYRYWVIEKSHPTSQNMPVKRLTTRGWVIFILFALCSSLLFLGIQWYVDLSEIGITAFMAGYVFLLIGVLTGSVYILQKYSVAEVDV